MFCDFFLSIFASLLTIKNLISICKLQKLTNHVTPFFKCFQLFCKKKNLIDLDILIFLFLFSQISGLSSCPQNCSYLHSTINLYFSRIFRYMFCKILPKLRGRGILKSCSDFDISMAKGENVLGLTNT